MIKVVLISLAVVSLPMILMESDSSVVTASFLIFVYTTFFNKNEAYKYIPPISLIIASGIILIIGTLIKGAENTNFYGAINILIVVLSAIIGIFSVKKSILNKLLLSLTLLVFLLMYNLTVPHFLSNKLFFDSLTGRENKDMGKSEVFAKMPIAENKFSNVSLTNKDEVLVLDFWNNGCGTCFEKFPKFRSLAEDYKTQEGVKFFAVNIIRSEGDLDKGIKLFDRVDRGFESLYMPEEEAEIFGIEGFPTTLVIKNNKIIYRGNIEVLSFLKNSYLQ